MENSQNKKELKLRSVRIDLALHEYECLKAEADKDNRAVSRQLIHILMRRYNKLKGSLRKEG